jgi:hypothetical protein
MKYYQSPEMKEKIKALGMELLDYDACSTIWVKDWESWERFSSSPEYAAGSYAGEIIEFPSDESTALMPDADHFMDYKNSGIKVMAG